VTWNRFRNVGDGTIGSGHSAYVQFARTTDGYIANNKGIGAKIEDSINLWQSSGSSSSRPIIIEHNQLEGTTWTSFSGAGIRLGDGGGSHVVARFNTLLSPAAVGISVASGTDMHVNDNIIYGVQRPLSYMGIDVWNHYPSECSGIEVARNQVKWYAADGSESGGGTNGGTCGWISGWSTNNFSAPLDPVTLHVKL
jgi:hypothetical protein